MESISLSIELKWLRKDLRAHVMLHWTETNWFLPITVLVCMRICVHYHLVTDRSGISNRFKLKWLNESTIEKYRWCHEIRLKRQNKIIAIIVYEIYNGWIHWRRKWTKQVILIVCVRHALKTRTTKNLMAHADCVAESFFLLRRVNGKTISIFPGTYIRRVMISWTLNTWKQQNSLVLWSCIFGDLFLCVTWFSNAYHSNCPTSLISVM